jgi:hypothetical protein
MHADSSVLVDALQAQLNVTARARGSASFSLAVAHHRPRAEPGELTAAKRGGGRGRAAGRSDHAVRARLRSTHSAPAAIRCRSNRSPPDSADTTSRSPRSTGSARVGSLARVADALRSQAQVAALLERWRAPEPPCPRSTRHSRLRHARLRSLVAGADGLQVTASRPRRCITSPTCVQRDARRCVRAQPRNPANGLRRVRRAP